MIVIKILFNHLLQYCRLVSRTLCPYNKDNSAAVLYFNILDILIFNQLLATFTSRNFQLKSNSRYNSINRKSELLLRYLPIHDKQSFLAVPSPAC